jgi:hypothetical protein
MRTVQDEVTVIEEYLSALKEQAAHAVLPPAVV